MSDDLPSPWWDRKRHQDRRPFLVARGQIKQAIRTWFLAHGFVEVETSALQVSPGNETHLHAFETEYVPLNGDAPVPFHLHTSPEFACKKLLAAGETRIFTFAACYRNCEHGPLHHPEFTMLEWYRTEVDYHTMMADCADILRVASEAIGAANFSHRETSVTATNGIEEVTVADAFLKHANIDLRSTYTEHKTDGAALILAANAVGIRTAPDDTWSDVFTRILVEKIEPNLGRDAPTILKDYPVHEAALAATAEHDAMIAERFEIYLCGLELANAFTELSDPAEQRRRFEEEMDEKERLYGKRYPIDEDFLAALKHMPDATGCALGFDRLVMLATGAERIDQVIWTPLALEG